MPEEPQGRPRIEILVPEGDVVRPERRGACGPLRPYRPPVPGERRRSWRPAGEPARARRLDLRV